MTTDHESRERILTGAVRRARQIPEANRELHGYASREAAEDAAHIVAGGRIQLPIPQGELLPAEERLQNVLKAIEGRLIEEASKEYDSLSISEIVAQRNFISGLDIAWSLAQTEILRRTDSP
jgi:hypothetical protein